MTGRTARHEGSQTCDPCTQTGNSGQAQLDVARVRVAPTLCQHLLGLRVSPPRDARAPQAQSRPRPRPSAANRRRRRRRGSRQGDGRRSFSSLGGNDLSTRRRGRMSVAGRPDLSTASTFGRWQANVETMLATLAAKNDAQEGRIAALEKLALNRERGRAALNALARAVRQLFGARFP